MASSSWSPAAIAGYLLIVVFWGFNYLFVNLGLEFASPLWLAALRAGVGALSTLAIVSGFGGWGTLDRAGKRDALLLGIPNTALFFGLWFWAARSVLPGIAAVVVYTFPLWVALLSAGTGPGPDRAALGVGRRGIRRGRTDLRDRADGVRWGRLVADRRSTGRGDLLGRRDRTLPTTVPPGADDVRQCLPADRWRGRAARRGGRAVPEPAAPTDR